MTRSTKLTLRLALASILSTAAVTAVCIVALVTLVNVSGRTRAVVSREVDLLRDAAAFDALIYQKGFVANYMLTRDPVWLKKLEVTRAQFTHWVTRSEPRLEGRQLEELYDILREDNAYDSLRRRALELFDRGYTAEAVAMIPQYHRHIDALVGLAQQFSATARSQTQSSLIAAERSIRQLAWLLVITSLISALSSVTVGYLWARRVARPLYELQLQVQSAAQRTRIHVPEANGDDRGLAAQIAALVHKAEEADAELTQQRRRLIQSEKMSAIGELAAKLGHEILNPLAGMKAAVQLMSMQADSAELSPADVQCTSAAIGREVTRIEQLVRRLLGYARPLTPELSVCDVDSILKDAQQAVEGQTRDPRWRFVREVPEDLPAVEVDRLLMTQVFVNVLRNAVEAMPQGGTITTRVRPYERAGRRHVVIEIRDEGPGLSPEAMARVFTPFHSTKPTGHGLGLATSRNIVVEHGGAIEARNRSDRSGAAFEVSLPVR